MSNETSTTTPIPAQTAIIPVAPPTEIVRMSMETVSGFEALQRAARLLSASSMVPEVYRGAAGVPNAVIAMEMSTRLGASPLMIMQNLYIVHGNPGWSAKFLTASVNSCGRFTALRYESKGAPGANGYEVRAWAVERATGEKLVGPAVTWAMVNAEGWLTKSGSKWRTMPEVMAMYRAAAFWVRAYAPEISMGLQTREELDDGPARDVTPEAPERIDPQTGEVLPATTPAPADPAEGVRAHMRGGKRNGAATARVVEATATAGTKPAEPQEPSPAADPQLSPDDLAVSALATIGEMNAESMGAVGQQIARHEKALGARYPEVLKAYQTKRRGIEDGPKA